MERFSGIVKKGTARAAALGFPTVNITLANSATSGIYAGTVLIGQKEYYAAIFADPNRGVLEAHLLDFPPRDLTGETITITLHEKLRDTMRFDTEERLRQAIADDVQEVRTRARKTI